MIFTASRTSPGQSGYHWSDTPYLKPTNPRILTSGRPVQERMQLEMKPIGASMGYEVTNTGFCVTRVDAGLPCIKGEANLVQHRTPVASQCLVALQHLETWIFGRV